MKCMPCQKLKMFRKDLFTLYDCFACADDCALYTGLGPEEVREGL